MARKQNKTTPNISHLLFVACDEFLGSRNNDGGQLKRKLRRVNLLLLAAAANGKSHETWSARGGVAIIASSFNKLLPPLQTTLAYNCRAIVRRVFAHPNPNPSTVLGTTNIWASWNFFDLKIIQIDFCLLNELMWVKRPIADGKTFFLWTQDVRVERIWKQDYFHVFFAQSRRWFNVHLPSVRPFYDSSIETRTKRNSSPENWMRRRRRERENWKVLYANRRQVKRRMLHLRRLFSFCFSFLTIFHRASFLAANVMHFLGIWNCEFDIQCLKESSKENRDSLTISNDEQQLFLASPRGIETPAQITHSLTFCKHFDQTSMTSKKRNASRIFVIFFVFSTFRYQLNLT